MSEPRLRTESVTLWQGDCLQEMDRIASGSVDMVLCDLPYGTTDCSWDAVIPFAPLWSHYRRIIKPRGAIVLTASQPFTSALVMSNPDWFRYEWVWNKKQSGSFHLAKFQPLKITESVCVFGARSPAYYPQKTKGKMRVKGGRRSGANEIGTGLRIGYSTVNDEYFPTNILDFPNCGNKAARVHPTQKPVALFEYLIRTYTNGGETVMDNCAGSGTTGIAAMNAGRNAILIEREESYCEIISRRISEHQPQLLKAA